MSVREAAVSLLGRHVAANQGLALRLFNTLARASTDPGTSVRKSAIKILFDSCIKVQGFPRATGGWVLAGCGGAVRGCWKGIAGWQIDAGAGGCMAAVIWLDTHLSPLSCLGSCPPACLAASADACKHVLMRSGDPEESIQDMVAKTFHR